MIIALQVTSGGLHRLIIDYTFVDRWLNWFYGRGQRLKARILNTGLTLCLKA
jgi:hypothetical protein